MKAKRAVIKLGTNSITKDDGSLNEELLNDLCNQIIQVLDDYNVLIVTSGAVGAGISLINEKMYDDVTNRQIYAAVGQVQLMKLYAHLFSKHHVVIAQMLATKDDFSNRNHYLNMKNCLESLFKENIIPIMNENDFVAIEELMFTDNDELAGMVSKMLNSDIFVLLTNVDGVFDEEGKVISKVNYNDVIPEHIAKSEDKSSFGKGGIQTKFRMAQAAAKNGTEVFITNSKIPNVILRILNGEHIGTKFIPRQIS